MLINRKIKEKKNKNLPFLKSCSTRAGSFDNLSLCQQDWIQASFFNIRRDINIKCEKKSQIMWKSKMVNLSFRILTKYVGCMVHGGHAIVYVILCNSVQIDLNSVYLSNRVGWNGWRYLGGNLVPWKPKEGKSWGYQTEQCHRDTNWWSQPRQQ